MAQELQTTQPQILDRIRVQLHDNIAPLLDAARKHFVPGVKLTLIVRSPEHAERDIIVSDDTLDEVNKVIQRKLTKG
jgi:hypothetical protein